MKKILLICATLLLWSCAPKPVSEWTDQELDEWLSKNEWTTELPSKLFDGIDKRTFAEQYQTNRPEWDAALAFLKAELEQPHELGRYPLTEKTYANVETYKTRYPNKYEAHKKYIDVQYVLSGEEDIKVCELDKLRDTLRPFSEKKDIGLWLNATEFKTYKADSTQYLILFPTDAHNPCLTRNGKECQIRKVCVKVAFKENQMVFKGNCLGF